MNPKSGIHCSHGIKFGKAMAVPGCTEQGKLGGPYPCLHFPCVPGSCAQSTDGNAHQKLSRHWVNANQGQIWNLLILGKNKGATQFTAGKIGCCCKYKRQIQYHGIAI